jgi:hypothetical protein
MFVDRRYYMPLDNVVNHGKIVIVGNRANENKRNGMQTLADLKRRMIPGVKLIIVSRFGQSVPQEMCERELVKVQTNSWCFKTAHKPAAWLDIPKASLLEITDNGFKIYGTGSRPLNAQEKALKDGYEAIRNRKQEEIDMLSDGSTSYYQEKAYYREHNANYLMGHEKQRGMRYCFNTGLVQDDNIKGALELEYQFINDKDGAK